MSLLNIQDLSLAIHGTPILNDISLTIAEGEIAALTGESGSGKSMTAFTPMASRMTFVQGLEHPQCVSAGGHSTADSFLTGSNPSAAVKSPSLDQIAAMIHGHKTRYPSPVLGNEGGWGGEGR